MPENTEPINAISLPCNPCPLCGKNGIMYLNFTFVKQSQDVGHKISNMEDMEVFSFALAS